MGYSLLHARLTLLSLCGSFLCGCGASAPLVFAKTTPRELRAADVVGRRVELEDLAFLAPPDWRGLSSAFFSSPRSQAGITMAEGPSPLDANAAMRGTRVAYPEVVRGLIASVEFAGDSPIAATAGWRRVQAGSFHVSIPSELEALKDVSLRPQSKDDVEVRVIVDSASTPQGSFEMKEPMTLPPVCPRDTHWEGTDCRGAKEVGPKMGPFKPPGTRRNGYRRLTT